MCGKLLIMAACFVAGGLRPAEVEEFNVRDRIEVAPLTPAPDLPVAVAKPEPAALPVPATRPMSYEIKAMVDGRDVLMIRQNMMQWHHLDFQAVGRYDGAREPTTITTYRHGQIVKAGEKWFPVWPEDADVRTPAVSAVYLGLDPALPSAAMQVSIEPLQCRGNVRVVQTPSRENDYTLKVEFDDNAPLGWDWYHVRIIVESIDLSGTTSMAVAPTASPPAAADLRGFIGPLPYKQKSDSPLQGIPMKWWHLEDFEDGRLNTPGVSARGGCVDPPSSANDNNNDSVDGDDGKVDGFGRKGRGYYAAGSRRIRFQFNKNKLGRWPDCVGIVWTDVVHVSKGKEGHGDVFFEAFDADGTTLGKVGPFNLGDGRSDGLTDEDRFFGIVYDGGVSAIEISMPASGDWEVDHLQYGRKAESPESAGEDGRIETVQPDDRPLRRQLVIPKRPGL